jgi:hypothetical protein
MLVPKGSTVMRIYELDNGSKEIVFEGGDPADYIWSTWEKSNWKSLDWLMGKVENDQYGISKEHKLRHNNSEKQDVGGVKENSMEKIIRALSLQHSAINYMRKGLNRIQEEPEEVTKYIKQIEEAYTDALLECGKLEGAKK